MPRAVLDFAGAGKWPLSIDPGNMLSADVVAQMMVYLLAQMVVLADWFGDVVGVCFSQTKALMKSVLCSTEFLRRAPEQRGTSASKVGWARLAKPIASGVQQANMEAIPIAASVASVAWVSAALPIDPAMGLLSELARAGVPDAYPMASCGLTWMILS